MMREYTAEDARQRAIREAEKVARDFEDRAVVEVRGVNFRYDQIAAAAEGARAVLRVLCQEPFCNHCGSNNGPFAAPEPPHFLFYCLRTCEHPKQGG